MRKPKLRGPLVIAHDLLDWTIPEAELTWNFLLMKAKTFSLLYNLESQVFFLTCRVPRMWKFCSRILCPWVQRGFLTAPPQHLKMTGLQSTVSQELISTAKKGNCVSSKHREFPVFQELRVRVDSHVGLATHPTLSATDLCSCSSNPRLSQSLILGNYPCLDLSKSIADYFPLPTRLASFWDSAGSTGEKKHVYMSPFKFSIKGSQSFS